MIPKLLIGAVGAVIIGAVSVIGASLSNDDSAKSSTSETAKSAGTAKSASGSDPQSAETSAKAPPTAPSDSPAPAKAPETEPQSTAIVPVAAQKQAEPAPQAKAPNKKLTFKKPNFNDDPMQDFVLTINDEDENGQKD